jgi:type I restriction enzyme S subunit
LERSLVFPGDIVIAKIGMNYGASATIPNGYPKSILSGNTMKITPNLERIELEYLQHELHYLRQIKEFDRIVSITAQPAITLKDVKRMKMALPPLDEQHRISNILSSCDEEFTQALKYRAKLGELKKALMNVLLTGKVRVQV